jgi:YVTN family beta-propeller protein
MRTLGTRAFATIGAVLIALGRAAHAAPAIQSSPIVESDDGKLLLNVNPDSNSVSVFTTTNKKVRKIAEIPVGKEPVSVALTSNRKRAFVANSRDNTVTINLTKRKAADAIQRRRRADERVLSPNDKFLYVANSSSNNIQVFDAKAGADSRDDDRFEQLRQLPCASRSPMTGTKRTTTTLFVAMFFGQLRAGKGGR